jgi:hypothetical protein
MILRLKQLETEINDRDNFHSAVYFSAAPEGDPLETEPTEGIAVGRDEELGLDFKCRSFLIYTFEVDPSAVGGFRIDYSVIP